MNNWHERFKAMKKANGILEDDEKVVHVGMGLYIPKTKVESFLKEYKK